MALESVSVRAEDSWRPSYTGGTAIFWQQNVWNKKAKFLCHIDFDELFLMSQKMLKLEEFEFILQMYDFVTAFKCYVVKLIYIWIHHTTAFQNDLSETKTFQ